MSNFFGELKRRNVFRVALLYLVGSWLVLQVGEILFEALALPDWSLRFILAALLLGFPIALVFSWVYELTPDGIKREKDVDRSQSVTHETSRKLDLAVIAVVLVGLAVVLGDRFLAPADTAADEKAVPSSTPDAVEQDAALPAEPTPGKNEVSPAPAPDDSAPAQSVAVLPFTTRSTDPEDEFFADGMHDDLLTQLAKIGALKVISRTSVMEYKETTKKVPEIADELNVATVVEGGVQRAGSRVRINAQLIDADTDQHLWAETFDRELTAQNIFDIQTEIATAIAEALQATLTPEEETRIGRKLTDNLEAWEAYRRGLRLLNGISPDDYQRALLEAQRALELDPDFAAAYSVVARVHMARFWFFGSDPADRRKAWAAIEEGRRIAPESPELDIAEAYYHYWGHLAYDEALAALNRAIQAIPNDAELYKVKGYTLRRAGRYAESIATLETAHELDPRNPLAAVTLAEFAVFLGRFDEAQRWIDEAGDTGPDGRWLTAWRGVLALMADADFDRAIHYLNVAGELNAGTIYWGWFARLASGRHQEALEVADFGPYTEYAAGAYPSEVMIGITHRVMGEPKLAAPMLSEAREALSQLIESDPRYLRPMCLAAGGQQDLDAAQNYCAEAVARARPDAFDINNVRWEAAQGLAMAGDEEGALNMLEGMLENPARVRATVLRVDPLLENLRDHPRFEPLLERIDQVEPLE